MDSLHISRSWILYTTFPHYLAMIPVLMNMNEQNESIRNQYLLIIWFSTTFSLLWHSAGEPLHPFLYVNGAGAASWMYMELLLAYFTENPGLIYLTILLNAGLSLLYSEIKQGKPQYVYQHCRWNCLSCIKTIFLAWMVCGGHEWFVKNDLIHPSPFHSPQNHEHNLRVFDNL